MKKRIRYFSDVPFEVYTEFYNMLEKDPTYKLHVDREDVGFHIEFKDKLAVDMLIDYDGVTFIIVQTIPYENYTSLTRVDAAIDESSLTEYEYKI